MESVNWTINQLESKSRIVFNEESEHVVFCDNNVQSIKSSRRKNDFDFRLSDSKRLQNGKENVMFQLFARDEHGRS